MGQNGFIYDKMGLNLKYVDWIEKPGACQKDRACLLRYTDPKGVTRCTNTLVGHSCKHVVNGYASEKERFVEAANKMEFDSRIPLSISDVKESVVSSYKKISLELLKDAEVTVSGEGENIRFVCSGRDFTDGMVDFLGFEPPWIKRYGEQYEKPDDKYRVIGIISAYFNYSSPDTYAMYRLVHQKYYERKDIGTSVSPTLGVEQNSDYWGSGKGTYTIPIIDEAFSQGGLYYLPYAGDNYSAGVVNYYYNAKYGDYLCDFYNESASIIPKNKKAGKMIWDRVGASTKDELKGIVKVYENVYATKIISDYLKMLPIKGYKPEVYCGLKGKHGSSSLTKHISYLNNKALKLHQIIQYEMIVQRRYLERKRNVFEKHFAGKSAGTILDLVNNNYDLDPACGSIADHTAFSYVDSLIQYYLAAYVFLNNCVIVYGEKSKEYEWSKDEIHKWIDHYEKTKESMNNAFFMEWLNIYDDIFQMSRQIKELG